MTIFYSILFHQIRAALFEEAAAKMYEVVLFTSLATHVFCDIFSGLLYFSCDSVFKNNNNNSKV